MADEHERQRFEVTDEKLAALRDAVGGRAGNSVLRDGRDGLRPDPNKGFGKKVGDELRDRMRTTQPNEYRFCLACQSVTLQYQVPDLNPDRPDGKWAHTYDPPLRKADGTEITQAFLRSTVTWCEAHSGTRPLRIERPVLPLSEDTMERAAIIEYCGGFERLRAERLALEQMGAFQFRRGSSPARTDKPERVSAPA